MNQSEQCTSLPGQAVDCSQTSSSDTDQLSLLNGIDTPAQSCENELGGGWFPELQVHEGDIRLFDPSEYAGRVDCIHAGFPCQDISVAGNSTGIEGERSGLWSEVVRCADVLRPRYLWLENSPAITIRGLDQVLADLTKLGYDARWCVISASTAGAPHLRARWWCLASLANTSSRRCSEQNKRQNKQQRGTETKCASEDVGHTHSARKSQPKRSKQEQRRRVVDTGEDVSKTNSNRLQGQQQAGTKEGTADGSNHGSDSGWWSIEPDVGRVVDGLASRVDRIKALGNGQVPLQAAIAWHILGGP